MFHNLQEVGVHVTPTNLDMKPFQTTKKHPQISSCEHTLSTKTFCNLLIMPLLYTLLHSFDKARRPTNLYQVLAYLRFPLYFLNEQHFRVFTNLSTLISSTLMSQVSHKTYWNDKL